MEQACVLAALRILFCSGVLFRTREQRFGWTTYEFFLPIFIISVYLCAVPMTAAACLQIVQEPHYHTEISPYLRRSPRVLPSLEGSSEYSRLQALKS